MRVGDLLWCPTEREICCGNIVYCIWTAALWPCGIWTIGKWWVLKQTELWPSKQPRATILVSFETLDMGTISYKLQKIVRYLKLKHWDHQTIEMQYLQIYTQWSVWPRRIIKLSAKWFLTQHIYLRLKSRLQDIPLLIYQTYFYGPPLLNTHSGPYLIIYPIIKYVTIKKVSFLFAWRCIWPVLGHHNNM